ncbi:MULTISPECIES: phage tail sheath C-terminal domain-containing protein [Photorhabdus]|uniref:Phage tail protein n=1 Tax=Photorhabdus thracensis TaxID=230089 RepID=A0A0F7LPM6_9GAMM|nr:phage tail sheath C-terminal domain-containing protein [Photorhabdus thracensis]AKH65179.1 phage tail protein [Photorhabdus thracensis]MCC8420503.1 phage tail sheath family protein [Photorhabdus thracensis]
MASATYATPGVYIEEDASLSLSINTSPTAIPVFIGKFFKKDGSQPAKGSCIRIANWLDFTSQFSLSPAVSVQATGDGDEKTYTATVTATSLSAFAVQHYFNNGGGVCYLLPLVETVPDEVTKELETLPDLIEKQQEITLLVCPETNTALKQKVYDAVNSLLKDKVGYFLIADSTNGTTDKPTTQADKTAVYYPDLVTSFTYSQPADDKIALHDYTNANTLAALKTASPEEYAKAKKTINDALRATKIILPPSAAVAGAYAATDVNRGVWKAPANLALNNAKPSVALTDTDQGTMNEAGINVIRAFTGKGTLIWGSRTLDKTDNWRYIPVRRLFNAAERDIKKAMRFAVFEPNSQPTWKRVQAAIDNYLYQLWQQGALAGNKPQEAYFVQIGKDITMSDTDIKQGKMIVKVGMAAVRPAEFIILQFSQNVAQ